MPSPRIFFFLWLLAFACSCTQKLPVNQQVFHWNIASGITSLDPAFARSQANTWMVNQIFNGLVRLDDSLKIQPDLAKSWQVSDDGLHYCFHLRAASFADDSCFPLSKGRKVTANDFVYSFARLSDPATASPGAWVFSDKVESAHPFLALNDSTLEINLQKPFRPFLQLLALKYASVVPHEAVEYYKKDFRTHPVGTGPFRMLFYYEGEKLILARNDRYYEAGLPHLDRVSISFLPSKQNEYFSFLKGNIDILTGIDPTFKDNILTADGDLQPQLRGKFTFEKSPFLNTEYVGVLMDDPRSALRDMHIRQAINYAINREKMIRYLHNGIGTSGENGFVPPALLNDTQYYSYDLAKARRLMKTAGFDESHPLTGICLATTDQYLDMAILIQSSLKTIGIEVTINNLPASTLSEWKADGKVSFFRGSWVADYADPENFLSIFYSKNKAPDGPNYFHFSNSLFDSLYENALSEKDDRKVAKLYKKMQSIVMREAPVVVLFYDESVRLVQKNVTGLHVNPINMIDLRNVRILRPLQK